MLVDDFVNKTLSSNDPGNSWMSKHLDLNRFLAKTPSVKVWGASNGGKLVYDSLMARNVLVNQFIDTDIAKQGEVYEGVPVVSPNSLESGDVVVIGTMYQKSVFRACLSEMDVTIVPYDDFQNEIMRWNIGFIKENIAGLQLLYDWLEDEESRIVLRSAISFGLTRSLSGIAYSEYPQYSHPFVKARHGGVVIDGGAYNGDSASRFLVDSGGFCSLHCFEPLQENVDALYEFSARSANCSKICVNRAALADFQGELFCTEDQYSPQNNQVSLSSQDSSLAVPCVSIDRYCLDYGIVPTLVKLDLEGFEVSALRGAKHIIEKHMPDLQIAIYHNPEEFLQVPMMVKDWVPDYQLFLGHHGEGGMWDTVLYCKSPT